MAKKQAEKISPQSPLSKRVFGRICVNSTPASWKIRISRTLWYTVVRNGDYSHSIWRVELRWNPGFQPNWSELLICDALKLVRNFCRKLRGAYVPRFHLYHLKPLGVIIRNQPVARCLCYLRKLRWYYLRCQYRRARSAHSHRRQVCGKVQEPRE